MNFSTFLFWSNITLSWIFATILGTIREDIEVMSPMSPWCKENISLYSSHKSSSTFCFSTMEGYYLDYFSMGIYLCGIAHRFNLMSITRQHLTFSLNNSLVYFYVNSIVGFMIVCKQLEGSNWGSLCQPYWVFQPVH